MIPILRSHASSLDLAEVLGLEHEGRDLPISVLAPLGEARPGALVFSTRLVVSLGEIRGVAVIARDRPVAEMDRWAWIKSKNPRLDFARACRVLSVDPGFVEVAGHLQSLDVPCELAPRVDPTAAVHPTAVLGYNVVVGARTTIGAHAVLSDGVLIGEDCTIKPGAVIGEDGYGFERDERGIPIRLMHFGGAVIHNRVEIGSFTTVCQGTLTPTIIADDAKIDDHVHIAHNVHVGRGVMVVAGAIVCGSVVLEDCCYVGPNASIRDGLRVGARSFVGIGAVVVKDVLPDVTVAGCPAKEMEPRPR